MATKVRTARRRLVVGALASAALLAGSAGSALGATKTASADVGPVPVPNVPVQVCVGSDCVSTPPLGSVRLRAAVALTTGSLLSLPPIVMPGSCPAGQQGVALRVISLGVGGISIAAEIAGALPAGGPFVHTLGPIETPAVPLGVTTVSACTTLAA